MELEQRSYTFEVRAEQSEQGNIITGRPIVYNSRTNLGDFDEVIESGGGGGTSDYTQLSNKPQINSIELTGDKSSSDLGLQDTISDLSTIRSNASAGAGAAAKVTGITETGNDYIKMGNGITLYISATQPQNPSEGDLWIGG